MKTLLHTYGLGKISLKEKRLCHLDLPTSTEVANKIKDAGEYLKRNIQSFTEATGEIVGASGKFLVDLPSGLANGLVEAWKEQVPSISKEDVYKFLYKASEFFTGIPYLGEKVNQYFKGKVNFEKLKHLVEHANWIAVFERYQDVLTGQSADDVKKLAVKERGLGNHGMSEVLDFMATLDIQDRQRIFAEYVGKYIPENLQSLPQGIAQDKNADLKQKFDAINTAGKVGTFTKAMGGMLGVTNKDELTKDPEALKIAKRALEGRYGLGGPNPTITNGLLNDYKGTLRFHQLAGLKAVRTSPDELKKQAPDSLFKGALELGVIDASDLQVLSKDLADLEDLKQKAIGDARKKVNVVRGDMDKELQKEASTYIDVWNNMGGAEKLILMAGGIYAAYKYKTAAMLVALAYFGRKFLSKDDDPLHTASVWMQNGVKKGQNAFNKQLGITVGDEVATMNSQVTTMAEFITKLHPRETKVLTDQAAVLTMMYEMPLKVLSAGFNMCGGFGEWCLAAQPGSAFDTQMKIIAERNGVKNGYKQLFCGRGTQVQPWLNETISFLFYKRAAKDPANKEDVEIVENAIAKFPSGTSPQHEFGKPENQEAAQAYMRLVRKGHNGAAGDNQTIGSFIEDELGAENTNVSKENKEKERKREMMQKLQLKIKEMENKDEYRKYALGDFHARISGDFVEYASNFAEIRIIAKSPAEKFLKKSNKEIFEAYKKFHDQTMALAPGTELVNKDPL